MQEIPFNQLDDLYQEVILDHYRNPRNSGEIPNAHVSSRGFNPFCGDEVVLGLNLNADHKVESVAFQGQGCSISQASASIMTMLVKDKTLAQAEELSQLLRGLLRGNELSRRRTGPYRRNGGPSRRPPVSHPRQVRPSPLGHPRRRHRRLSKQDALPPRNHTPALIPPTHHPRSPTPVVLASRSCPREDGGWG